MTKKMKVRVFLIAASCLLLANLVGGDFAAAAADPDSHLNFGCYNYSDSLDPATNTNASWAGMRFGITECLFKFSKQVVAEPNICDTYSVSDDYKTWTLHIREGVKFSNGNPVTASAVKNCIQRLYDMTDSEKGGTGNSVPRGYLRYDSISADDAAGTVTLVCQKPTSNIPGILAYPYFAIIDISVADSEIVGSGPYRVTDFKPGTSVDLARNVHYWNGEVPYGTITILFINDSSTKAMALQSGDVDLVENITTAIDLENLKADTENYYVSVAAGVRTANSYMNYKGVLENDTLRQAIMLALDKKTMCDVTVGGMYTAGYSVLPSSLAYNYEKLKNPYEFNRQAAIDLLDKAGIVDTDGDGFRELDGKTINLDHVTFTSRNLDEFAEAAYLQLADIGIQTTVNVRDYDTALALLNAGEFDLWTCNTLTVGVGDPQDYLANWYSGNSKSFGFYSSPRYAAAYEQLQVEVNNDRRLELITEMQQILIDDAATIIYGYYNSSMASDVHKVTGADIATIDYYWLTTDIKPVK
ncbi:MAG: ABC transporter substrate-binding protein [Planctomycetaceae bacterium]|nr:ABC transporter substrate-binding protein [Planctomycetaceae bacterium]